MTIGQLHGELSKLINAGFEGTPIVFEVETRVEGGIMGRSIDGWPVLNLTPIKLDQVGGF